MKPCETFPPKDDRGLHTKIVSIRRSWDIPRSLYDMIRKCNDACERVGKEPLREDQLLCVLSGLHDFLVDCGVIPEPADDESPSNPPVPEALPASPRERASTVKQRLAARSEPCPTT